MHREDGDWKVVTHVIAIHAISDPQTFWSAAESEMDNIPEGTTLHSAIPSQDGSRTVCVWESDSVDTVRGFVEKTVGHVSTYEYFPVDAEHAIGVGCENSVRATEIAAFAGDDRVFAPYADSRAASLLRRRDAGGRSSSNCCGSVYTDARHLVDFGFPIRA